MHIINQLLDIFLLTCKGDWTDFWNHLITLGYDEESEIPYMTERIRRITSGQDKLFYETEGD